MRITTDFHKNPGKQEHDKVIFLSAEKERGKKSTQNSITSENILQIKIKIF